MDGSELEAAFRQRADDTLEPYLYSQADVFRWATEAEIEACTRAKLIYDTTSPFLSISVVAGQADYTLDARIDRIDDASFTPTGTPRKLGLRLEGADFIRSQSDWRNRTGRPDIAARNRRVLTLWPTPTETGIVRLAVYRFPLYAIETGADEPEIPVEFHHDLVWWMLYLAYTSNDDEVQNSAEAMSAQSMFERRFGERPNADVLRRHREKRRVTTRYGGY